MCCGLTANTTTAASAIRVGGRLGKGLNAGKTRRERIALRRDGLDDAESRYLRRQRAFRR